MELSLRTAHVALLNSKFQLSPKRVVGGAEDCNLSEMQNNLLPKFFFVCFFHSVASRLFVFLLLLIWRRGCGFQIYAVVCHSIPFIRLPNGAQITTFLIHVFGCNFFLETDAHTHAHTTNPTSERRERSDVIFA